MCLSSSGFAVISWLDRICCILQLQVMTISLCALIPLPNYCLVSFYWAEKMALKLLYQELVGSFVTCPIDDKKFLPRDSLERIISEENVKSVLCIKDGLYVKAKMKKPSELPGIVAAQARGIFAALVLMDKIGAIYGLLDEGLVDEHLPLTRSPKYPECDDLVSHDQTKTFPFEGWSPQSVDDFIDSRQWRFLSPVLDTTGQLINVNQECALPLVTSEYKGGSGAAGIVLLASLHPAHQRGFQVSVLICNFNLRDTDEFRRRRPIFKLL